MAGTYEFADDMCPDEGGSALCIDRDVTIEAEVAGSVVLDAQGARRVMHVSTAGRVELIGLNITGGAAVYVSLLCSNRTHSIVLTWYSAPLERDACSCVWQAGGGLYIEGTATLTNTNVYANEAKFVCLP